LKPRQTFAKGIAFTNGQSFRKREDSKRGGAWEVKGCIFWKERGGVDKNTSAQVQT